MNADTTRLPLGGAGRPSKDALHEAGIAAASKVAPLWPLRSFVAVNPLLGFASQPFAEAAAPIADGWGIRPAISRKACAEAFAEGRLTEADIEDALGEEGLAGTVSAAEIMAAIHAPEPAAPEALPSFADIAAKVTDKDWPRLVTDRITHWAAGYYDEGQAAWPSPFRDMPAYAAWRAEAALDFTPRAMGLQGFRAAIAQLPEDPMEAIAAATQTLGVEAEEAEGYYHRLLATVSGWAGHARRLGWIAELRGGRPESVLDILAIRLSWEAGLAACLPSGLTEAWAAARRRHRQRHQGRAVLPVADLVLQTASEIAFRRRLIGGMRSGDEGARPRPDAQIVMCIDVRSERMRRAIEAVSPKTETIGFAGFFGVSVAVEHPGLPERDARCPVLLEPAFTVEERPASDEELERGLLRRKAVGAWKAFKLSAVSSFAFVEAAGLGFAGALLRDAFAPKGKTPRHQSCAVHVAQEEGKDHGLPLSARIDAAMGMLAGMSLTERYGRLVLLAGHGSTTANNPFASSLDCGACGGHAGDANARLGAQILNDGEVRKAIAEKGRALPEDTVFLAGLHDTTTDALVILDEDAVPASHKGDLHALKTALAEAGRRVRQERAPSLGLAPEAAEDAVPQRSLDWSQVRPEWGLAGCAGFVAAPRGRTSLQDLEGRVFLHDYDYRADESGAVLELILTAPVVVASWISLQYFASTVAPEVFGSGDKTLHNVVSGLGVLEGNAGDLRTGLPLQSVHDGARFVHEPLRLTVAVEAPTAMIDTVLEKHENVRALFDNGWLRLLALEDDGRIKRRYAGGLAWQALSDVPSEEVETA